MVLLPEMMLIKYNWLIDSSLSTTAFHNGYFEID
jgi:hypothetical protein